MKKIIFSCDILYSPKEFTYRNHWIFKVFYPIIRDAVSKDIELTFDIKSDDGEEYSRDYFWGLNGIKPENPQQKYNAKDFSQDQIDYLKKFFDEDTVIIGFELYQQFSSVLTLLGAKVIDMAFHPFKLFDDLAYGFYSNNKDVYNQLLKYQIPQEKFYYYANYWKTTFEFNPSFQSDKFNNIEDNCAIFIGQTFIDRSVDTGSKYLNVTDYGDKLKELSEKYSKVYYIPHPFLLPEHKKIILDYVANSPYITLLRYASTYNLLASDKVKKVVGISTSVLYEAEYFNKEIEYLFKPLFNVDTTFEDYSYTSILNDYWNPKFWADILAPVCDVNTNVKNINHFLPCKNKMRDIKDLYWGYKKLDPIKRMPSLEASVKNIYKAAVELFSKK